MAANFSPTAGELALVNQIFAVSDPQKVGVLTGEVAVRVFGGAHLQPTVLGQIWGIADEDNKGWLSKKGVAVALRLIGWAQKGEKVTADLISKSGPLPTIDGVSAVVQHNTGPTLSKSPPPGLPAFTPQDKAKFQKLFQSCNPVNGLLSADVARDVFVKSKLPVEKLIQIWNLADTQDRGSLDSTDFAIGMYLIQATMSGQLSFIPTSLPPGLYEQAGGTNHLSSINVHHTGTSGSFSPTTSSSLSQQQRSRPIQPQYTGQSLLQPQTTGYRQQQQQNNNKINTPPAPAPRLPSRPPASAFGASAFGNNNNQNTSAWDVTVAEKASSDQFFDKMDQQKRGFIEGDVVVPFMLESKLSGDDLALVWDLSDIQGDGRLTRDGFAVAMHLIQGKLAGRPIPATLPASLIPPSMRPAASQPEPVVDLLWGDDTPPSSAVPQQQTGNLQQQMTGGVMKPQSTGGIMQPQSTGGIMQPQTTGSAFTQNQVASHSTGPQLSIFAPPAASRAVNDPFASSHSSHFPQQQQQQQVAPQDQDLLGDDADVVETSSALVQTQAAEIGNVQNQLTSTHSSLESTKAKRAELEQALANQAGQLSALQTQLATAKSAYETEQGLSATLNERLAAQTADINKTRTELISAESDLSAIRVERSEVEGMFLRDKEEARDLHRKMIEVGQQVEVEKAEVEKLKKEAKQQKGLLAIARKQLSTKETERARVQKEMEEAAAEKDTFTKEKEQIDIAIAKEDALAASPAAAAAVPERTLTSESLMFAAAQSLPMTPNVSSPAASINSTATTKSNNPFERLAMGSSTPRSQSPFQPMVASQIPTPSTATPATAAAEGDPFGFSDSNESTANTNGSAATEVEPSTPKQLLADIVVPPNGSVLDSEAKSSIESDRDFTTPPSTAVPELKANGAAKEKNVPAELDLDSDQISPFPALSTIPGHFPLSSDANDPNGIAGWGSISAAVAQSTNDNDDSDLTKGPQTLDVVGHDSDSDSEDEIPLSELKGKGKEKQPETTPAAEAPTNGTSFDDVFGGTGNAETDLFGASKPAPVVAGVNAFDEAMGTIPAGTAAAVTAAPEFSFDTAFDDDFDFASASETVDAPAPAPASSFPPVASSIPAPSSALNGNGHANEGFDSAFGLPSNGTAAPTANPVSFDDVFANTSTTSAAAPNTINQSTAAELSFDEAFSGTDPAQALKLETSFGSPASKSVVSKNTNHSSFSTPSSPHASISTRPASPPPAQQRSPAARASSPKPRPSSSFHKEEKPKESRSKLSIRLPFGRKKKVPPPEPMPSIPAAKSTHLSPPREEEDRANTPALSDDVDAVQQLCGMGFSRTKAIAALEANGYDVQRALNSLIQ